MSDAENDEGTVMKIIHAILEQGVDGIGPMTGSVGLADEFRRDARYADDDARVTAMIRWESSKNFGTGFLTGLGGLLTLPVAVPAALYASWIVQARLAGAIANLRGFDTKEDRVRTLILLSLIGDAGKEILKNAGVRLGNKLAMKALEQIPGKVFIEINKKVGFRLITKAGETGIVNLIKVVPVAGGIVSGGIDAASCVAVGRSADALFGPTVEG